MIRVIIFAAVVLTSLATLAQEMGPNPFDNNFAGDTEIAPLTEPEPGIDNIVTGAVMTEQDMLQYCVNIQDTAREARYAFLQQELDKSQMQLEEKLKKLTQRLAEIREYVERRERFLAGVDEKVVGIYQEMRSDAAAQQLSELDTGLAASIIAKLAADTASDILTEMTAADAAAITKYLSAATRRETARQTN